MNNMSVMKYAIEAYGHLVQLANGRAISGEEFAAAIRKAYEPSVKTAIVCDCVSRYLSLVARKNGRMICEYISRADLDNHNDYER